MITPSAARRLVFAVAILSLGSAFNPVKAVPLAPGTAKGVTSDSTVVTEVRWRRGGGAALAAGLMTGLFIGGLAVAPRYYYGEPYPYYPYPYPYYGRYYVPRYVGPVGYDAPDWEAHCFSRYRSFDPYSGTYLGRDGRRHYCR